MTFLLGFVLMILVGLGVYWHRQRTATSTATTILFPDWLKKLVPTSIAYIILYFLGYWWFAGKILVGRYGINAILASMCVTGSLFFLTITVYFLFSHIIPAKGQMWIGFLIISIVGTIWLGFAHSNPKINRQFDPTSGKPVFLVPDVSCSQITKRREVYFLQTPGEIPENLKFSPRDGTPLRLGKSEDLTCLNFQTSTKSAGESTIPLPTSKFPGFIYLAPGEITKTDVWCRGGGNPRDPRNMGARHCARVIVFGDPSKIEIFGLTERKSPEDRGWFPSDFFPGESMLLYGLQDSSGAIPDRQLAFRYVGKKKEGICVWVVNPKERGLPRECPPK